ncbi:MAG: ribosome maturation factor RimM [Steroidobacteraceae bacterium]
MKTVEIGRISKPHGVRGELKVVPHWDRSDALLDARELIVELSEKGARAFRVEGARRAHRTVLVKLAGIDDRDQAATLRGARVSVGRDELPKAGPGEIYLCDLIGLKLVAPSGVIGKIIQVRAHPSVDTLVIQGPDGVLLEQPFAPPWIEAVDLDQGLVTISSTDGLIA